MIAGHKCDAPVGVIIGSGESRVRIPVIDEGVTLHEWKDGPMAITRRAEVTFPLTDGETDWVDYINAFKEGGEIQQATVRLAPFINEADTKPQPILRGYVSSVGSNPGSNQGHLTVMGPFKLLSQIGAGASFNSKNNTPLDILTYIRDRFVDGQPIFDTVEIDGEVANKTLRQQAVENPNQTVGNISFTRRFSANRDDLSDVVKFYRQLTGQHIWFEPGSNGGLSLVASSSPGSQYDARDDTDVSVIENDAIFEMQPFNALVLAGEQGNTDIPIAEQASKAVDSDYPEAEAYYPELVERAGGKITKRGTSSKSGIRNIETEARARLKNELDDVSGGTMTFAMAPKVMPYDRILAQPACAGVVNTDTPSLKYEVQRVAHTIAPKNDNNNIPSTEIAVSMEVDSDDIIVNSRVKSVQPTEGGENKPPREGLRGNIIYDTNND